ncbi:MAG: hypothetical protein ACRCX2_39160 [Paraclostridium sp.]
MNQLTHEFFDFLFEKEYSKNEEMIFHVRFRMFREDRLGNIASTSYLDEELKFILHKEATKRNRFITIVPKLGKEIFISVCSERTELPYLIGLSNVKENISDLTYDEIDYYLEKFIGGIKENEEKKKVQHN